MADSTAAAATPAAGTAAAGTGGLPPLASAAPGTPYAGGTTSSRAVSTPAAARSTATNGGGAAPTVAGTPGGPGGPALPAATPLAADPPSDAVPTPARLGRNTTGGSSASRIHRDSKAGELEAIQATKRQGTLFKQSDVLKQWRSRFFVLEGKMLYYYKAFTETTPRDNLYLTKAAKIEDRGVLRRGGTVLHLFSLRQPGPDRAIEYRLGAYSEEDKALWMAALNRACKLEAMAYDAQIRQFAAQVTRERSESESSLESAPIARKAIEGEAATAIVAADDDSKDDSDAEVLEDSPAVAASEPPAEAPPRSTYRLPPVISNSTYARLVEEKVAEILRLADTDASAVGWQYNFEQNGVVCYLDPNVGTAARGDTDAPVPARSVWKIIMNSAIKKEIDSQFDHSEIVEDIDVQTKVDRMQFKGVVLVSPRDFCNLTHYRVLEDGTIVIVATSITHPQCPEKRGIVRANTRIGGWVLRPTGDRSCRVTYLMNTDLSGTIPSSIVKRVASQQPLTAGGVRDKAVELFDEHEYISEGPLTNSGELAPAPAPAPFPVSKTATAPTKAPTSRRTNNAARSPVSSPITPVPSGRDFPLPPVPIMLPPPATAAVPKPTASLPPPPPMPQPHSRSFLPWLLLLVPWLVYSYWPQTYGLDRSALALAAGIFVVRYIVRSMLAEVPMSTRRKLMIATWGPPSEGNILGAMAVDMTNALKYLEELRSRSRTKVTITSLCLKAIAMGIRHSPSLNGRIVFDRFVPHNSIDLACLVVLEREEHGHVVKDLGSAKIKHADRKSVLEIAKELSDRADRIRNKKDDDLEKTKPLLRMLPVGAVRLVTTCVGFLGAQLGISLPFLGVQAFPFGSCMVSAVGTLGLDMAWAPFTPFAHVPLLVTLGAVEDKVIAVDGAPAVRKVMNIMATLDHRYMDGAQGAMLAKVVRTALENPHLLDA